MVGYCVEVERDDVAQGLVLEGQLVDLDQVVLDFILQHSKYYSSLLKHTLNYNIIYSRKIKIDRRYKIIPVF